MKLPRPWKTHPTTRSPADYPEWVAYEPSLVPPPDLMAAEGITVLEEWFRWGEEWSVLLRVHAGLARDSTVLEIGCGLGRVAFPLRYVLGPRGRYEGFEISRHKVDFLQRTFQSAHPNFHFTWADVLNTHYNPGGACAASEYRFPYPAASFDVVFAASVFTHMAPANVAHYFDETARVLRPGGRALFSFFLLDRYQAGVRRPPGFDRPDFDFDHTAGDDGGCAIAFPDDLERMTAYRLAWIERAAQAARLVLAGPVLPGYWTGAPQWVGSQDLVVLTN